MAVVEVLAVSTTEWSGACGITLVPGLPLNWIRQAEHFRTKYVLVKICSEDPCTENALAIPIIALPGHIADSFNDHSHTTATFQPDYISRLKGIHAYLRLERGGCLYSVCYAAAPITILLARSKGRLLPDRKPRTERGLTVPTCNMRKKFATCDHRHGPGNRQGSE